MTETRERFNDQVAILAHPLMEMTVDRMELLYEGAIRVQFSGYQNFEELILIQLFIYEMGDGIESSGYGTT